jgi:hypothetical protein
LLVDRSETLDHAKDLHVSVGTKDEIDREVRPSVALAGAGGDPPRRPDGSGLKKGHYLDADEVGRLPVMNLVGVRMAQASPRPLFVDPASRSDRSESTRALALRQTTAARSLLYHPGETFRRELGGAADTLHRIASQLDVRDQRALGGRLLGSEGLLPNQPPSRLLETLRRVADDPVEGRASATDRAIVIALMGDIGALYADTGATTGVENRSERQAAILRQRLRWHLDNEGLDSVTPRVVKDVQHAGGSSVVGPTKKAERTRPPNEKPPRSGIHNLGREADIDLNIPDREALPTSRWDVAHIRRDRVDGIEEPLVGHMSGSPAEILQVWDMLRGVEAERQYVGILRDQRQHPERTQPTAHLSLEEREQRLARAAGAGAFLVGLGYHSAVEVAEGVLAYTGQDARSALGSPRQDAGHLLGNGAATSLISELFEGQTRQL